MVITFLIPYLAQADCYQEGERFWETNEILECCPGLVKSVDSFPQEPIGAPDSCIAPTCRCFVCIRCGDGICGTAENWCNCLTDCEKPEEVPCKEDIDCGTDSCQQGRNRCIEIKHRCIVGECRHSTSTYTDFSCARYYFTNLPYPDSAQCIDTCGDGMCRSPETRWWCPEDCECADIDNDSICDWADNCPDMNNPDQEDNDNDAMGDVCDTDDDNDGFPDELDACPLENSTGFDADEDGCLDTLSRLPDVVNNLANEGMLDEKFKEIILSRIDSAIKSVEKENICTALNKLESMVNEVNSKRDKKVSHSAADLIIEYTENIIKLLLNQLPEGNGC